MTDEEKPQFVTLRGLLVSSLTFRGSYRPVKNIRGSYRSIKNNIRDSYRPVDI
jgi:hypothetical protein